MQHDQGGGDVGDGYDKNDHIADAHSNVGQGFDTNDHKADAHSDGVDTHGNGEH